MEPKSTFQERSQGQPPGNFETQMDQIWGIFNETGKLEDLTPGEFIFINEMKEKISGAKTSKAFRTWRFVSWFFRGSMKKFLQVIAVVSYSVTEAILHKIGVH